MQQVPAAFTRASVYSVGGCDNAPSFVRNIQGDAIKKIVGSSINRAVLTAEDRIIWRRDSQQHLDHKETREVRHIKKKSILSDRWNKAATDDSN